MATQLPGFDPIDVAGTALLSVTMLAAGAFLGVEVVARVVLSHQAPLAELAWLDTVESIRLVLLAATALGFASLLALEFFES